MQNHDNSLRAPLSSRIICFLWIHACSLIPEVESRKTPCKAQALVAQGAAAQHSEQEHKIRTRAAIPNRGCACCKSHKARIQSERGAITKMGPRLAAEPARPNPKHDDTICTGQRDMTLLHRHVFKRSGTEIRENHGNTNEKHQTCGIS